MNLASWYVPFACVLRKAKNFGQVASLESPVGNEHLNSSLFPTAPSDIASSLEFGKKRDYLPPLPSHNSQPDVKTGFTLAAAPTMKRNSSLGPFRQSALGVQPTKKRLSTIGVSSSHGRLFKLLGDFYLLAGRTEDALVWYVR